MKDTLLKCKIDQSRPFPLSVELNCPAREIHAVVGPSGSGKSTLLRSIAGIHRPDQAEIKWDKHIWQQSHQGLFLPPHKRLVGSLWQQYSLFPHLTVTQNIAIASPWKHHRRRQQINELMQELQLTERAHAYPQALSGGEQQRVALARALARRTPLLLLDEPFNALDRPLRTDLLQMTRSLCQSHRLTVLWVTHDIEDAFLISDRISLLRKGQCMRTDSPEELVRHPHDLYVIKQLGWQNYYECEIERIDHHSQKIFWQGLELISHCPLPDGYRFVWATPASAIQVVKSDCAKLNTFKATVVCSEIHAREKLLRVRLGESELLVPAPWSCPTPGEILHIHLPPERLYMVVY